MSRTSSDDIPLRTLGGNCVTCPVFGLSIAHTVHDPTSTQGRRETEHSSNASKIELPDIPMDEIVVHATDDAVPIDPPPHDVEDKASSDGNIGHPAVELATKEVNDSSTNDPSIPMPMPDTNPEPNRPASSTDVLSASDKALAEYVSQCVLKGIRDIRAEGSNGWADIHNTVKEIDDEKLGNCKEDIDTLLVFAGLFSAVLTAFIIESYQTLSPDTADMTVQLLNRIAVQTSSYTITPSFMNATETTPPFDPFEPSSVALRINRLWFASLVVSLMTASFGILIKQWLREYKAVDPIFSNMRSRLRIRQFRYPGLVKWKVFEVAAVLPLFIQLALGLFLLGLCLFTWSVNTSIGHDSTALVAAWIFFFIAAALSPAISSDCPYKISFLSPILPTLRFWMSRLWTFRWTYIGPRIHTTGPHPRMPEETTFWCIVIAIFAVPLFIFAILAVFLPSPISGFFVFISSSLDDVWSHAFDKVRHDDSKPRTIPLEEREVAKTEDKDLEVLSTVDNAILDDEHLTVTMRSIIARSQFRPEDIVNFACQALQRRLPQLGGHGTESVLPVSDLRSLPPRSVQMLVDITFDALQKYYVSSADCQSQHDQGSPGLREPPPWICNAIAIIASAICTSRVIIHDTSPLFSRYNVRLPTVSQGAFAEMPFKDVLEGFRRLSHTLVEDPMAVSKIFRSRHCSPGCKHDSLAGPYNDHFPFPSLEDQHAIQAILLEQLRQTSSRGERPSQPLIQLFFGAMYWFGDSRSHSEMPAFFSQVFEITITATEVFTRCLSTPGKGDNETFREVLRHSVWGVHRSFESAETSGRAVLLHVFIYALHYSRLDSEADDLHSILTVFDFCDKAIEMYDFATEDAVEHEEEWTVVLYLLDSLIRRWSGRSDYKDSGSRYATSMLMAHWVHDSAAFASFGNNTSLLPYWNRILESLHMCLHRFPDEDYMDRDDDPLTMRRRRCDRAAGDITVKFNRATLEHMENSGWHTTLHDAAGGDANGGNVVTPISPDEESKVKERLSRILRTKIGIEPFGESAPATAAEDSTSDPVPHLGDPADTVDET